MTDRLQGKRIFLTGAAQGIGLAIAEACLAEGASLFLVDMDAGLLEKTVARLDAGDRLAHAVADISDSDAIAAAVQAAKASIGPVNALINNAGINVRKPPETYTLAEWRTIIDGNLTSAFLASRAVYPALVAAGGGKIINIGSLSSILGLPFAAPYAASKGGIVQLTRSLATAWAKDNIQVNAVLPGWVDTDLTRQARIDVPGLNERVLARTPAQRWGVPEDFAGVAVYLASPASDYVTGAAIPIDGGYAIQV